MKLKSSTEQWSLPIETNILLDDINKIITSEDYSGYRQIPYPSTHHIGDTLDEDKTRNRERLDLLLK